MNRWLAAGLWLLAVGAMVSAAQEGSAGVGALWSLPAALVGTFAVVGWPDRAFARIVAALGVVWQLALIGAWWPFALHTAAAAAPLRWPLQSLIIAGVLAALVVAFIALFLLPGLALCRRISSAAELAWSARADHAQAIGRALQPDLGLLSAWEDYQGQWSPPSSRDPRGGSRTSAADWFEMHQIAQARLRIDFFRNLPGVFTGLGIIGTFTGLILGLRSFHISQDPAVIQNSLEALLSGVWEAFMISALAIALAITLTVIEKLLMTALARRVERLVLGLDRLHPVQAGLDVGQFLQLVGQLGSGPALRGSAEQGAHPVPARPNPEPFVVEPSPIAQAPSVVQGAGDRSNAVEDGVALREQAAWIDVAAATRASALAVAEAAQRLPEAMARQLEASLQSQQGALQGMRALSSRLEGVASGIEVSGRKTLEGVAGRLMQAEMSMISRHHAMVEHLGEVVQRMEALCGLLQQDRQDMSAHGQIGSFAWAAMGEPPSLRSQAATQMAFAGSDGATYAMESAPYDGQGYGRPLDDDPWAPRASGEAGFGS